MKHLFKPLTTALAAALQFAATAAVPVAWTNSPGMPPYPIKPVPHGVPIDFRVTLKGYTEPLIAPGADLHLWYQTNGMGKLWWPAPAALEGDTITATFGPSQDCGADRVSLFFGAPSNVFASAVLRLTHAPGFTPSSLPLPVPALDFAAVELRNLSALTNGWSFGSTIGNYAAVSNAAMSAAAQTNDFLRLTGGSMQGPICFPYFDDYGVSISPYHPGALSFDSTYPDYSGLHVLLDISRVPTDDQGFGTAEIAYLSDIPDPSNYATKSDLGTVTNALAGKTFDFSTNAGLYLAVSNLITALGGSVANFPAIPQGGN